MKKRNLPRMGENDAEEYIRRHRLRDGRVITGFAKSDAALMRFALSPMERDAFQQAVYDEDNRGAYRMIVKMYTDLGETVPVHILAYAGHDGCFGEFLEEVSAAVRAAEADPGSDG